MRRSKSGGGGTPSKAIAEYWHNGTINWYTPSDLTSSGTSFMDRSQLKITTRGLRESSAQLFPAYSVMMTSRATIGVVSINTTEASTNQGFITSLPNERVPLYFLYFWIRQNVPVFESHASGATFKEITKGTFKKLPITVPPQMLINDFERIVAPQMELVLTLQRQIEKLRASRDLLLPKLLSGEIDLSKAEAAREPEAA